MLKFSLNKVNINIIDDKTYKKYGKYFTIFMYNKNNFSSYENMVYILPYKS